MDLLLGALSDRITRNLLDSHIKLDEGKVASLERHYEDGTEVVKIKVGLCFADGPVQSYSITIEKERLPFSPLL